MVRALAGSASRMGQSDGGIDPTKDSPDSFRWVKFATEFCPASKTTVTSAAAGGAGGGGQSCVSCGEQVDHRRELGDVGAVAGVGVRHQRCPGVASDDHPQTDQPPVRALLLGRPRWAIGAAALVESM